MVVPQRQATSEVIQRMPTKDKNQEEDEDEREQMFITGPGGYGEGTASTVGTARDLEVWQAQSAWLSGQPTAQRGVPAPGRDVPYGRRWRDPKDDEERRVYGAFTSYLGPQPLPVSGIPPLNVMQNNPPPPFVMRQPPPPPPVQSPPQQAQVVSHGGDTADQYHSSHGGDIADQYHGGAESQQTSAEPTGNKLKRWLKRKFRGG
jgi:hypothetical protein